jgi:hypothetical protein
MCVKWIAACSRPAFPPPSAGVLAESTGYATALSENTRAGRS